ncbi:hypothetical protein AHS24_28 [Escherichia phage vB_EcoS_AHS24]|uniref:Uncharacterized protein n=1 Tax=Escherichia phage vB_EcoS_AHS24 TaxID=1416030 RepID=A0A067YYS5_9CAUD|nr:hypothetical protein LA65_gp28 [Escherichia phage vB_EcoS_AHS24]AHI60650.1 hypothetical protein AHS24_28 [Escherichia phage vB_EcoS_AHS24]
MLFDIRVTDVTRCIQSHPRKIIYAFYAQIRIGYIYKSLYNKGLEYYYYYIYYYVYLVTTLYSYVGMFF